MPQAVPGDDADYGSVQNHLDETLVEAKKILEGGQVLAGETSAEIDEVGMAQHVDDTAQTIEDILAEYAEGADLTQESLTEATRLVAQLREKFPDAAEQAKG